MTISNFRKPASGWASDYEDFLQSGDADFAWVMPSDEWDAISLNYTSGTTGNPKGVVCHHRGAALMGYSNVLAGNMPPIRCCCGPCRCSIAMAGAFPGRSSVVAGTHVCLRWVRARRDLRCDRRAWRHPSVRRADRDVDLHQCARGRAPHAFPNGSPSWSPPRPPPEAVLARDGRGRIRRRACLWPDRGLWPRRGQ